MRAWLLRAAMLGLAVRLAFGLGYWVDEVLTRDEREYLSLARSVAAGHGFVYDEDVTKSTVDPFGRAPGYPAFLAFAGGGGDDVPQSVPWPVKVWQALLGALGVVMVGVIARAIGGARAGIAAALIAAVYPPLVWISAYAFSEALCWPIGLAAAWCLDRTLAAEGPRQTRLAIATGLLAGVSVLIRPSMLFFVLVAAAWLLMTRRLALAAVVVAGTLIVIGPWTVRNAMHYGRFVLVASEGGVTFWTGNHPLASGDGDMAANPDIKRASQALKAAHSSLTEEELEPVYYREALTWIRQHPIDWLKLEARKLFYLIVPVGPSYGLHSIRYQMASVLSYGLLLPLALLGAYRAGRQRLAQAPGLWVLLASAVLVSLVFFPQERFRIPIIDPALAVLAGGAFLRRDAV